MLLTSSLMVKKKKKEEEEEEEEEVTTMGTRFPLLYIQTPDRPLQRLLLVLLIIIL